MAAAPASRRPSRGLDDPVFTNATGSPIHPESISQLFARQLEWIDLSRIRLHDLRLTHSGFTMNTYQHVMPGMGATAAGDFGAMLSTQRDHPAGYQRQRHDG